MSFLKRLIAQLKIVAPLLIVVYLILLGLLSIISIICVKYNFPIERVTRDPAVLAHFNPFTGALSNIGILFWCSTAAICFFSSTIHSKKENVKVATFLFYSGLLSSVLLLDDLFMFHERIFPKYLHIPENLVYSGYLALVSIYLIKFKSMILETEYIILLIAFGFFALSILCDVFLPSEGMYLIEDGFKLFGIITWFIFFTKTCLTKTRKILES